MPESLRRLYRPPSAEKYKPYLINTGSLPPMDVAQLNTQLLIGNERKERIKTPVTGDATLALIYKNREGAVTSFGLTEQDLEILQLQGAKQEGFRVNRGLRLVAFFADQIRQLANHPESGLARITMPPLFAVDGIIEATTEAIKRYKELADRLEMRLSEKENRYIRDIK